MTVYNNFGYNGSPPLPEVSGRPIVGTTTVGNVNQDFDASPYFNMYEDFIVKYEGHITSPIDADISFFPPADDGTKLFIDGILVDDNWFDKGGGANPTQPIHFNAGESKTFMLWFYENGGGAWVELYWDLNGGWEIVPESAFTQDSVTPAPPYLNTPSNVQVISVTESSISISWDTPEQSNADVERYAVMWSCENNWDAAYVISSYTTEVTIDGINSGTSCIFQVRADNDTIPVYSGYSQSVSAATQTTTTTSTTTTTTSTTTTTTVPETTTTEPETTTTTEPETTTTEPETTVPETTTTTEPEPETTTTTEVEVPVGTTTPEETVEETLPEPTEPPETTPPTSEPEIDVPQDIQDSADVAVDEIFAASTDIEELADAVGELVGEAETPEELVAVIGALLGKDLTDEQFDAVIDSVFSEPLSDENFAAALDAVFEEPLTDEQFDAVITAVLDEPLSNEQFEELVNVLESDSVSEEQVAAAVDEIIKNEISEEQAVDLATSEKVLQSIDGEQATEIFDAVDISNVTAEEAEQLVAAVQDAPTEVKEAFEGEINIFQGAVDTYVPLGSKVSVGTRRVIVAAAGVLFVAPTIAAAPPTAPINGSGNNNPSPNNGNTGTSSGSTESRRRFRGK
jgi:hypothetical protein